ncbi:hypothetical protein JN531_017060 (plasmid) [Flagellatimonas centrodinii]|uniref:hypothetical protein n=1 Tax=Flagellatimonas centrodinii TaxID=2806210 RepID=UPI001FFDB905|nr:hypothetical protein [Flagellatimonas centrodinii]ULQ48343.1 hypothetical protein JN531_017060 [Flagellatimonas centrodinii]
MTFDSKDFAIPNRQLRTRILLATVLALAGGTAWTYGSDPASAAYDWHMVLQDAADRMNALRRIGWTAVVASICVLLGNPRLMLAAAAIGWVASWGHVEYGVRTGYEGQVHTRDSGYVIGTVGTFGPSHLREQAARLERIDEGLVPFAKALASSGGGADLIAGIEARSGSERGPIDRLRGRYQTSAPVNWNSVADVDRGSPSLKHREIRQPQLICRTGSAVSC